VLEVKVEDVERDLATTGVDLVTANRQFSKVANQLQVVFEEAMRLREDNSKLSQYLDGEPGRPLFPQPLLLARYLFVLNGLFVL
jgi:hypothetical protein